MNQASRTWKRAGAWLLTVAMVLSMYTLPVAAEEDTSATAATKVEMVSLESDIWTTPLIPRRADHVAGVENPEISLNETTGDGTWKFLFDTPEGIPVPTAEVQDFDFAPWAEKTWKNIKVPGEALMQGFDILTNNEYYYQRELTIPTDYVSNRILVRFDGVYSNARVWIGSNYIRTHVGGFTTWDCDITDYVTPGETVTMTVGVADIYGAVKGIWNPEEKMLNNTSGASEYAHHNIGGINRDVTLLALPQNHIARTHINTELDANFEDAELEVTAQLSMASDQATLKIELLNGNFDAEEAEAAEVLLTETVDFATLSGLVGQAGELLEENKDNLYTGEDGKSGQYSKTSYDALQAEHDRVQNFPNEVAATSLSFAKKITIPVTAPKLWDAEHPNLYTLRTTLIVDDVVQQVNTEKFGFREIHYSGKDGTDTNRIYVNGMEVKLRGTCRHDVSYDLGRSTTKKQDWAEIQAYKDANINHVRTSHYPASENLLDACDELGIYVEQETAVCFQGYPEDVYSRYEDFGPQFTEMIERDRNRPSILIWSLGNESIYNKIADQSGGNAIQDERDYLRDVDTSRPCIFSWPEKNGGMPKDLVDIFSLHYAGYNGGLGSTTIPVLHDEYAHIACYNLDELKRDPNTRNFWGESIQKFWENIFVTDGALGGALWGGVDDVFYIPEGTSERWRSETAGPVAGYGEWGSVLDAYHRLKPEAYMTKKAYSPIRVDEETVLIGADGLNIPVKNWFDHTNMSEVTLKYSLDGAEAVASATLPDIAPRKEGNILLDTGSLADVKNINLQFYTADGVMVDEFNVSTKDVNYAFTPASETAPIFTGEDDTATVTNVGVEGLKNEEAFTVSFDKATAQLTEAKLGGTVLLTGGPSLNATGVVLGDWIPAAQNAFAIETVENMVVVTLVGAYENGQGVEFTIRISGNGIMTTDYKLTTAPGDVWPTEVGVRYGLPAEANRVNWLRNGLYTAYPKDHIGRNEGEALQVRKGSDKTPDQYGVKPDWPWKDDMNNYFLYSTSDPDAGLATNDFRSMREDIQYYNVFAGEGENAPRVSVEADGSGEAARINAGKILDYIDDKDARLEYTGDWDSGGSSENYAGTEVWSMGAGATCTLTFTGTGIRFIGARQNNVGRLKVWLDGEDMGTIQTLSDLGSQLKQAVIFSADNLNPNKEHTLTIEAVDSCIVVDAFDVITGEDGSTVEKQLVVNNQWYYPGLGWGNYGGIAPTYTNGTTGSVTLRLTATDNMQEVVMPSVTGVEITETEGVLTLGYDKPDDGTTYEVEWYQQRIGDPASKLNPILDVEGDAVPLSAVPEAKIYCTVTPKLNGVTGKMVKSNVYDNISQNTKLHDIVATTPGITLTGETGKDYQTDLSGNWITGSYGPSVTYLWEKGAGKSKMTFSFAGSGIRFVGAKENNQGIATITIDGVDSEDLDLFDANVATTSQIYEILFEKTWEEVGVHTITIEHSGKRNEGYTKPADTAISLDAFVVFNDGGLPVPVDEQPETEPLQEDEPAVPEDEPAVPEDEPAVPENEPAVPEDKAGEEATASGQSRPGDITVSSGVRSAHLMVGTAAMMGLPATAAAEDSPASAETLAQSLETAISKFKCSVIILVTSDNATVRVPIATEADLVKEYTLKAVNKTAELGGAITLPAGATKLVYALSAEPTFSAGTIAVTLNLTEELESSAERLTAYLVDGEAKTELITTVGADGTLKFTTEKLGIVAIAMAPRSTSSSSSSSTTTTVTEKNDDGSTTKTVTNQKTGEAVATTTYPDGAKVVATTPKGGETTAKVTLPSGKTQVTLTIPGVPTEAGTVAVIVHADGTEEIVKTSVTTEEGMRVLLTENATLEFRNNAKSFADVEADAWYQESVDFVTSRELFGGTGDGAFSPALPMDRGMLVTVLYRLANEPESGSANFGDVKADAYYADAVAWASEQGVMQGTGAGFQPQATITRESLIVTLYRYAKAEAGAAEMSDFADGDQVSPWAEDAMRWAVSNGLLVGKDGNRLDPTGGATRAEVAALFQRFITLMVK